MLSFYVPYIKKIIDIGKKVLFVGIVYFTIISLFAHFINRDKPRLASDAVEKNRREIYKVINDPQLNRTPQGKLSITIYRKVACGLIGEGCTNNPNDWEKHYSKSFIGSLTNLIVLPYMNPPSSGVFWAYEKLQNVGFIPKAYAAQGIGLGSIQPLSKIWIALRDLAYLMLVLVMITIGFMIMFRMKLNPQTVITVENALPKIVLSLILITFSLPIAGFLIDLMYVVIALAISVLGQQIPGTNISQLQQKYMAAGPLQIYTSFTGNKPFHGVILWDLPNALLNLFPLIGESLKYAGVLLGGYFLYPWFVKNVLEPFAERFYALLPDRATATLLTLIGAEVNIKGLLELIIGTPLRFIVFLIVGMLAANYLIPILLGLIILLTVIFIVFRIFFTILTGYVKILLLIAISPVYLLLEAFPGQSAFVSWLKSLVSELLVFPLVIIMILFSSVIVQGASSGNLVQFPFMFGIESQSFGVILGLFFLFMTPDIVKVAQQFLVPKPGPLEQAAGIGVFFGGATTGISGGLGELQKYAGIGFYIKPIRDLLTRLPGGKQIFNMEQHNPTHQ